MTIQLEDLLTATPDCWYSEPRDLTGHAGHERLREFWQAQPRPEQSTRRADSPADNNIADILARAAARYERTRSTAIAAHAEYQAGASLSNLARRHGITVEVLRRHWHDAGLEYEP